MAEPLNVLRWYSGHVFRRIGWRLSFATVALLAGSILFWKSNELEKEQVRLRARLESSNSKPEPLSRSLDHQDLRKRLETFHNLFPEQGDVPAQVKRLFLIAEKHGVLLRQGEYRATGDVSARLIRYQAILPVDGEATRLQGFVLDALATIPALVLEGISFKRESATAGELESRLRFVLLVRQP